MAVANTITNFQQTIWSASILRSLDKITSLRNHCNFQYEKDSHNAKEVKILSVNRPTIRTYVPGTAITREGAADSSQLLKIDQYRYFNFEVEDIVKAQSVPGLMEALTDEAGKGLALEGDKYVAKIVKDEVEGEDSEVATSASVIALTNSNAMASIEDGFAKLYENDCKVSDTFYLEVTPKVFSRKVLLVKSTMLMCALKTACLKQQTAVLFITFSALTRLLLLLSRLKRLSITDLKMRSLMQ